MNKKNSFVSILIMLAVIALAAYGFIPQIYKSTVRINKLRIDDERLQDRILIEEKKSEEYTKNINRLGDPFYREQIARKRLRMVKKGEDVYRMVEDK